MRIRSPLLTKLITRVGVVIVKLLFRTCRTQILADDPGSNIYRGTGSRRYLVSIWHDQIIMTLFIGRPQNTAGLVSQHQDGGYVAEVMKALGIAAVRGSTNRGGARAMRELMETTRDLNICITPDGPRGPRHELKTGLVFLASHTGRSIIPTAYACRRCWNIQGSWTDMMIPKPFTKIIVRGGMPIPVPPKLRRAGLDEYTAKLQAEMEKLEAEAAALIRGESLPRQQLKSAA